MRKITTIAGTSFLIWFLFSPVIGIYLFAKTYPDAGNATFINALVYVALTYIILGLIAYFIVKRTGGIFLEKYEPSEWGITVTYVVQTGMFYNIAVSLLFGVLKLNTLAPLILVIVSSLIFFAVNIFVANSVRPVTAGIVKKSLYLFFVTNILFAICFKFITNQVYLSAWDLSMITNLVIFYLVTKKYLNTQTK